MFDPYASGVLQKEYHERLVADLSGYARDAGIQPHWIHTALPDEFSAVERDYVRGFRRHALKQGACGIAYTGNNTTGGVEQRMSALAGCLVRNFIRARVVTLGTVLDDLASQTMPDISCLLIPNFFLTAAEGGTIAKWQINALLDYLTSRFLTGQQTILYVSDLQALGNEYGLGFSRLIEANYLTVNI